MKNTQTIRTISYKISKSQVYNVQLKDYSQYSIIILYDV